jgi:HIV Tat-specific factor 1
LNPADQQPKIRIYREEGSDRCKGDALICYAAEESVKLALDILDDGYIRPNYQVHVTKASFEDKQQQSNQTAGGKRVSQHSNVSHAQVKVAQNAVKQALTWNDEDDIGIAKSAALRIVVLEGMFKASDFKVSEQQQNVFLGELEKDVATEIGKIGEIEKLTVFTKNPKGVIVVKLTTSFAAQECIRLMNGRFFGGKKIKCYFWDGATNYSVVSSSVAENDEEDKEEEERLNEFGDWLEHEQEELPEEFQLKTE